MADASNREEWKNIAEAITQETDPNRVSELVKSSVTPWTVPSLPGTSQPQTECGFQVGYARCRSDAAA